MSRLPLAWILSLPLAIACSGGDDKGGDDTATDSGTDTGTDSGTDSGDTDTGSSTTYDQTDFKFSEADASFIGEVLQDAAGVMVAGPGDFDGDGLADMAIGAQFHSNDDTWDGTTYIELGSSAPTGVISLETTDTRLIGEAGGDRIGSVMSPGRDIDGDGKADLLLGAPLSNTAGTAAGAVFVVLAEMAMEGGEVGLAKADAIVYGDVQLDRAGVGVAGLGDVDGDDMGEVAIGASGADIELVEAGAVYVYSGADLLDAGETVPSAAGIGFLGELADDAVGRVLCGPGDLDGDGLGDLVVGRPGEEGSDNDNGTVYVFFSGGALAEAGLGEMTDADNIITGVGASDFAGASMAGVGDVEGDGKADLIIGAKWADYGTVDDAGAAYLFLSSGKLGSLPGTFASYDMGFFGVENYDSAGEAVAGAGDVDADGKDDLLVSTVSANASTTASSPMYLLLSTGVLGEGSGDWSLSNAAGAYRADKRVDYPGYALTGLGDVDGDGSSDLLFGAYGYDYLEFGDQRVDAGGAFLFYGFEAATE